MITNFRELVQRLQSANPRRVIVAGIANEAAIRALVQARREKFITPVVVDSREKIREHGESILDNGEYGIIECDPAPEAIAAAAVRGIRDGEGDLLMKGSIPTGNLMHAVLDKENGIRKSGLLSDCFLFEENSGEENRLITITDGGVVLYPDVDQKQLILENAVRVSHALGNKEPRVAICAAIEKVNDRMPPTVDAAELTQRYKEGRITGCVVDGPLALDGALSPRALEIKGIDSPLGGRADILVMPDIEAANLVAKSTQYIAGREAAHVIMGAQVPILIPSRSDSARGKYLSLALAVAIQSELQNES